MTQETVQGVAGERERVEELLALGIDSPLKLDLVTALDGTSDRALALDDLVAACGGSTRDLAATLGELALARVVEPRPFYNLTEYALSARGPFRDRLRRAIGRTAAERRRLRLALIARRSRG
jgi:uncharacterized protein with GYD domain